MITNNFNSIDELKRQPNETIKQFMEVSGFSMNLKHKHHCLACMIYIDASHIYTYFISNHHR